MSWITGESATPYGRLTGCTTIDLMTDAASAASAAMHDAHLERGDIDGALCSYSTTMPHLMLATVFAEHFGLTPAWAHAVHVGVASGLGKTLQNWRCRCGVTPCCIRKRNFATRSRSQT